MDSIQSESIDQLAGALASVIGHTGTIEKDRKHQQGWMYTSDAALLRALGPMMSTNGLALVPVGQEFAELDHPKGHLYQVTVTWRLLHSSGQWMQVQTVGTGWDHQDKAAYKAQTGALKYAMRILFAVPTGDDPDATDPPKGQGRQGDRAPTPQEFQRAEAAMRQLGLDPEVVNAWHESAHRKPLARLGVGQLRELVTHLGKGLRDDVVAWAEGGARG